jgi:hypothetical protein
MDKDLWMYSLDKPLTGDVLTTAMLAFRQRFPFVEQVVIHIRQGEKPPERAGVQWVEDKHTPVKALQFEV